MIDIDIIETVLRRIIIATKAFLCGYDIGRDKQIMDNCPNYYGADWKQQICLDFPQHMYKENGGYYIEKDSCCVDVCMKEEILNLWDKGVCTCGCCCSHGIIQGYIDIIEEHIPKMLELGYIQIQRKDDKKYSFDAKSKHVGD